MQCIGDECPGQGGPPSRPVRSARFGLLRGVGLALACAGLGYAAARHPGAPSEAAHLAVLAPPMVLVTQLAD